MRYIKLGKSDLKVSVIGLGTGQFGSKAWGYGVRYGDQEIMRIIQRAVELGINVFDTAETYGYGKSEILLGKVLKDYDRDNFVIITKVAPWNLRFNDVIKAAERSLRRLNIEAIDLYLIHYPNPLIPMKETFRAMEKLVKEGKVRYIGVSNFNDYLLRKAEENLFSTEIIANEIEYNILSRRAEKRIIPYCLRKHIAIIAYSPLAGGVLTGKYSPNNLPRDRARAFNFLASKRVLEKAQPIFQIMKEIAEEKGANVSQIALSWIVSRPLHIAIPAALSVKEVEENAKAGDIILSWNEIERISKVATILDEITYVFDHHIIRPISWIKEALKYIMLRTLKKSKNRNESY
jgi:aryl-alcohol dehydrogenase-like predicted oxidoreductase